MVTCRGGSAAAARSAAVGVGAVTTCPCSARTASNDTMVNIAVALNDATAIRDNARGPTAA